MRIVIIGGVAGGATAAARLRRLDEEAEIILIERGEYISYANCGLPYFVGGVITNNQSLTLQTPKSFHGRFNVDVRVLHEAVSIDTTNKTIMVKNLPTGEVYTERYDKLILSPGADPINPMIPGADSDKVFKLRDIPDAYRIRQLIIERKPRNAVVVGGGYIGIEVIENLALAGIDVTLIEALDHVIGPLDFDIAADVHQYITRNGVKLILNSKTASITEEGDKLVVSVAGTEISTDFVVVSVGVRPNAALAISAGLTVNSRNCIIVDEYMRTSAQDVYAVGDAVEVTNYITGEASFIPLAGPANKQARIAADHICGIPSSYKGTQGSAIVKFFDMTIATTGINERTAKDLNIDYEKSFTYSAPHASYYPGGKGMSIKLIFETNSGRVLGAQIVGYEGVDKRCDVIATAIRAGMTVYDLAELELCYAPPFSSAKDPVNMAGFVAENILSGKVNIFHWHDIQALDLTKVVLLDVRTSSEAQKGILPGSVLIPLHELRDRLGELDMDTPIFVVCQIGLRGYIACRLLNQHGFTTKNLSGGYRLYESVFASEANNNLA